MTKGFKYEFQRSFQNVKIDCKANFCVPALSFLGWILICWKGRLWSATQPNSVTFSKAAIALWESVLGQLTLLQSH